MNSLPAPSVFLQVRTARLLAAFDWTTKRLGLTVPPIVEISYLRSLPPDTFGRAWAQHLDNNSLQPFTEGPRRKQLHDGVHVLTGYGTDPVGEAEVQAFLVGAKFRVANAVLLAGLVRSANRYQRTINSQEIRSCVHAAYRRGQQARFDPDTWQPERLWEEPLDAVQVQFGL